MAESENRPLAEDSLVDEELEGLFAAFGDVRASNDLIARTLSRIEDERQTDAIASAVEPSTPAPAPAAAPRKTSPRRARFRIIRVAAIAACLVLALSGGIAYAVPSSHVMLSQGGISIDLGVNLFGRIVSATSDSTEGAELISETDIVHVPYAEGLAHAADALAERGGNDPLEMQVNAQSKRQEQQLEDAGAAIVEHHGEPGADALQQASPENAPSEQSQPAEDGQPQPDAGDLPGTSQQPGADAKPQGGQQPAGNAGEPR